MSKKIRKGKKGGQFYFSKYGTRVYLSKKKKK